MMHLLKMHVLLLLFFMISMIETITAKNKVKTLISEFVYSDDRILSCHASTLIELENGDILTAWFGGKAEGDKSVEIWMSRRSKNKWSTPIVMTNYPDTPTWNPVLFCDKSGTIWLFFKVGPHPERWTGAYKTSIDGGKTWSDITLLPAGQLGPTKNKPIQLTNGDMICGSSVEAYNVWSCWTEISSDEGRTWRIGGPITVPDKPLGVIQPTLWEYEPGKLKMLMRSTKEIGHIVESYSEDGGFTWSPGKPIESLPNPNSGIDAVKMQNGIIALVYNHTYKGRTPLNIAFSIDNGKNWGKPFVLEDGPSEYSYPAIIQSNDGMLHITYTWNRVKIKYVVIDPKTLNMGNN